MGSDVVFVLGGGLLRVLHSMEFGAFMTVSDLQQQQII